MPMPIKSLMPMVITCLLAGTVLAILAPLGTDVFAPIYKFSYWIGLCFVGGLGAAVVELFTHNRSPKLNPWICALYQSIAASLAVASMIWIMTVQNYGMPNRTQVFQVLFYVWVISMTISSIGALISIKSDHEEARPSRAALYERLPPHLRSADIYALAAEDHYVRVITARGDELVLMRLSDAIKETAPLKGLSPHRSYWVAEKGVAKTKKSELILHTNQSIPISRNGMKLVREAGWV